MQWLNAIFIISKCASRGAVTNCIDYLVRKTMYRYGWA